MSHATNPATVAYKDLFIHVSEEKKKVHPSPFATTKDHEEAAYDSLIFEI